jgi:hypothetical protein
MGRHHSVGFPLDFVELVEGEVTDGESKEMLSL